jgi:RES domain-containing protein
MAFKSWKDFSEFEDEVKFKNRFVFSTVASDFLENIRPTLDSRVIKKAKDSILYRSQIGDEKEQGHGLEIYVKFGHERMKPLARKASEGRANAKGIPYLYLADDKNTSMAELRPHVGQNISCAEFHVVRDLKLIDCFKLTKEFSRAELIFAPPQSQEDISNAIWMKINNAFTRPITNDDSSSEYVPTQILAEFFRDRGYDGIRCKSNMGDGHNFILFNLNDADVKDGELMQTKNIAFTFEKYLNNTQE